MVDVLTFEFGQNWGRILELDLLEEEPILRVAVEKKKLKLYGECF